MIKAVIFDLDDTLISELQYVKSGYTIIAKKIKKDYCLNDEFYSIYDKMFEFFEDNKKNVFNRLLDYYKLIYTENYIKELVKTYREHIPDIKFYDDVIPCLNMLKKKDIKTGIITDGYAITQKNKLKVLCADKWFDKIIITDELGREYWKPNSKAFEIMRNYFNIEYDEMMYVGDNPEKDFYIKKYYPIIAVRISRNSGVYTDKRYLEGIKEDYEIKYLKKIVEIL